MWADATNADFASTADSQFLIRAEGGVGIGTNKPTTPLAIRGNGGTKNVGITQNQVGGSSTLELTTADGAGNQATRLLLRGGSNSTDIEFYSGARGSETRRIHIEGTNGRVGIGTNTPKAPLHVGGSSTISSFTGTSNGGAWMRVNSGAGSDEIGWASGADPLTDVSIYASGSIVADGTGVFVAATVNWSDARIKRVIGKSNARTDLETLNQIEVTDYVKIREGNREKKVIAQQLRQIYPQAVSLMAGVVPNVFETSEAFTYSPETQHLTISVSKDHDFQVGDQVDVYTDQKNLTRIEVLAVPSDSTFTISANHSPQQVFVYGKWVPDVHTVDYDAISMLNVSATQELHRKVKAVEAENAELRQAVTEVASLKTQMAAMQAMMAQLSKNQDDKQLTGFSAASVQDNGTE